MNDMLLKEEKGKSNFKHWSFYTSDEIKEVIYLQLRGGIECIIMEFDENY
jgi:hypothetical protein